MKTLLGTFILLFAMQTASKAQCAVNFEKNFKNKGEGVYLKHFEVKSEVGKSNLFSIILREDLNYIFYLQNPSVPVTDVKLTITRDEQYVKLNSEVNSTENYSAHKFNTEKTGTGVYRFSVEFRDKSVKNCVVVAVYLDADK